MKTFRVSEDNVRSMMAYVGDKCVGSIDCFLYNSLSCFSIPRMLFLEKSYDVFNIEIEYRDGSPKTIIENVRILNSTRCPVSNSNFILLEDVLVQTDVKDYSEVILCSMGNIDNFNKNQ